MQKKGIFISFFAAGKLVSERQVTKALFFRIGRKELLYLLTYFYERQRKNQ